MDTRYLSPGRSTAMFNAAVARLTKLGVSVWGSRVLYVRGRSSGEWRSTPVNLLTFNGERYLVAPRGTTQWVRNLRTPRVVPHPARPRGAGQPPPRPPRGAIPLDRTRRRRQAAGAARLPQALED